MIQRKYLPFLSKFFSSSTIRELACTGNSELINYTIKSTGLRTSITLGTTYLQLFETVYDILFKYYRSEYVYKNVIANKILLGRHSLNTSTLLSEFRSGECKADVVVLNGTSYAYEIKTELDSLERLENQIEEYKKLFDNIYVVTFSENVNKIGQLIPHDIGIIVLTEKYTLREIRKSISNKANVDQETIFNSLRKSEYCNIIKQVFGEVPDVPNTQIYRVSKQLFESIRTEKAHDLMVSNLKTRSSKKEITDFIKYLPHSLKMAGISSSLKKNEMRAFCDVLAQNI